MTNILEDFRVKLDTLKLNNGAANQCQFTFAPDPETPGESAYPPNTLVTVQYGEKYYFYGYVVKVNYNGKGRSIQHTCYAWEKVFEDEPWNPQYKRYNGEPETLCPAENSHYPADGTMATISEVITMEAGNLPFSVTLEGTIGSREAADTTTEDRSAIKFVQDLIKRVPGARWTFEYPAGNPTMVIYDVNEQRGPAPEIKEDKNLEDYNLVHDSSETGNIKVVGDGEYHPVVRDFNVPIYAGGGDCCDIYRARVSSWTAHNTNPKTYTYTILFECVKYNPDNDRVDGSLTIKGWEYTSYSIHFRDRPSTPLDYGLNLSPQGGDAATVRSANSLGTGTDPGSDVSPATAAAQVELWRGCEAAKQTAGEATMRTQRSYEYLYCDTASTHPYAGINEGKIGTIHIPTNFPFTNEDDYLYAFSLFIDEEAKPVSRLWSPPPAEADIIEGPPDDTQDSDWKTIGSVEYIENAVGIYIAGDADIASVAQKDTVNLSSYPPSPPGWGHTHTFWPIVKPLEYSSSAPDGLPRTLVFSHEDIAVLGNPAIPGEHHWVGAGPNAMQFLLDNYIDMYGDPFWSGTIKIALECECLGGPDNCVYVDGYKVGQNVTLTGCYGDVSGASGIINSIDYANIQRGLITITLGQNEGRVNPFVRPDPLISGNMENNRVGPGQNRRGSSLL